jgi:hypothetical protein
MGLMLNFARPSPSPQSASFACAADGVRRAAPAASALGGMTRKQVAALAGVAPYAFESGTLKGRR